MPYNPSSTTQLGHAALAQSNPDTITVGATSLQDSMWAYAEIDESYWSQQFPYQLVFLKQNGSQYSVMEEAVFTLPIPPEELSRGTPFAIITTVTTGGIVEEHNGAPIRPISFSGTTGLLPLRGGGKPMQPQGFGQAISAGILSSGNGLINNIQAAVLGNASLFKTNLVPSGTLTGTTYAKSTGYYQFLMLQKFLEQYVTLKKTKAGSNIVLGLAIHKEKAVYLVSPTDFTLRRSKAEPLLWNYNIALRAWGRTIPTAGAVVQVAQAPIYQNKNLLTATLNALGNARLAAAKLQSTFEGFRADFNNAVLEPLRQTSLFLKDLLGATITCADLPANLVKDMKGAILEASSIPGTAKQAYSAFQNIGKTTSAEVLSARDAIKDFAVLTQKAVTKSATASGAPLIIDTSAHPANSLFNNPQDNFELFNSIVPGQLNLPVSVQAAVNAERARLKKLTRIDFATMRDAMVTFSADFADSVGAGDATYNITYGRPVSTVSRVTTSDEFDALDTLNEAILQLNTLAATSVPAITTPNVMEYVAALANPSGINFVVPNSKFSVPFPYGATLEQLSAQYLGDPNRWPEIATLNNLASPYVDEEGFTVPVISNGIRNTITVSSATNLFVGGTVYLQSNTQIRQSFIVQSITPVGVNFVIAVSNNPDLSLYTTNDTTTLAAFLPNTVNSQRIVYIPSDAPAPTNDFQGPPNEVFTNLQNELNLGGADLLLTGNGDLAITPNGDAKLAIGLANLVQRVRLAIDTPRGSLIQHPDYGFVSFVGESSADVALAKIINDGKSLFRDDPAFTGVTNISGIQDGGSVILNISVGVRNSSQLLPITVTIPIA